MSLSFNNLKALFFEIKDSCKKLSSKFGFFGQHRRFQSI